MNTAFAPLNKNITVDSFYFTHNLKSFPRRIDLGGGEQVTFAESGLRLLLRHGQRLAQLFDMNSLDGTMYRLRLENDQWTLVGVKGGQR